METITFPHLASLAYFQSSSTPCTTPILQPEPPTPQEMLSTAPTSSPKVHRHRRYSGIPRPASGSSRRATSSTQQPLAPGEVSSIINVPPSPCNVRLGRLPRSDSLQSCGNNAPHHRDLSGIRQQLHVRNFSTKSVQGLEVFSSPRSTAVRSLMRPLGPPMPRSHTMGNIALDRQSSSPIRKEKKVGHLSLCRSEVSPEIDVVDALHESRMTREEVELLNRIEKEKELNKARLSRTTGIARNMASPSHVAHVKRNVDTSAASWLSSSRSATSSTVIQEHTRRTADGKGGLRIDPSLANASRTPRATLLTPISALSTVVPPDEIDPRHVYFAEPTIYWTGRFIALCDKSKTQHVARVVSIADLQRAPDNDEHANAQHEPFETAERRRMRSILEDLRSCCQSELALKSFEKFEDSFLTIESGTPAETIKPATLTTSSVGATDVPITISKLRHPWIFGSTSNATNVGSRITGVSKTISSNKVLSMADKASGLAKSKTTGNLAEYQVGEEKPRVNGYADLPSSKIQHTRQTSNLSIQAQMNARALREREDRAARRADETKRRVNSMSVSSTTVNAHPVVRRSGKAQDHPRSEKMENLGRQVRLPPRGPGMQDVHEQPQAPRQSVVTTIGTSGPEKRFMDHSENRNTSVAIARSQVLGEAEALGVERQFSAPRELQRRTNRQSSGEMLKTMVTGGLKGVRRMGRSLTGKSELEELGQPFIRVARGSDLGEKRWVSRSDKVGAAI